MMRSLRFAAFAFVVLAVLVFFGPGCYPSLNTIVTPDKAVTLDDLPGDYASEGQNTREFTIEKGQGKSYTVKQFDKEHPEKVQTYTLEIIKLGNNLFYDVTMPVKSDKGQNAHLIGKLTFEKGQFRGWAFADEKEIMQDPGIKLEEVQAVQPTGEKSDSKEKWIAMPPEKLQEWLAAHADKMTQKTISLDKLPAKS